MKKTILLILFVLKISSIALELSHSNIVINNKIIKQDNPLIQKSKILYFPIRKLKNELNYSIHNENKINGYKVKFPTFTIYMSINSKELWINKNPYFFSKPTFKFKNELYVPLKEFLEFAGYSLTTNENIVITKKNTPQYNKKNITLLANKTSFPTLTQDTKTKLIHNNFSFPLKNKFFYQDDICYINLSELLENLGYVITKNNTDVTLRYGDYRYTIPLNQKKWSITHKTITEPFKSSHNIIIKNDTIYYPFQSFITFLDYSIHQKWFKNEVLLLSNINGISITKKNNLENITIHSRHKLNYSSNKKDIEKKHYIDIPFSFLKTQTKSSKLTHPIIDSFKLQKGNKFSNRLKLNQHTNKLNVFVNESKHGLTLQLNASMTYIKELDTATTSDIIFESNNSVSANLKTDISTKKIIIDFNHTINELPQIIKGKSKPYKSIRTSQFNTDPLTTRIVIEFESDIPKFTVEPNNNTFTIKLTHPLKTQSKATLTKRKKRKKKKTSLTNKIIIIDPGHGGVDPGAVVKNKFEKNYTLDVAKRLEKKLSQEGAYVIMTRHNDSTRSLAQRSYISNHNKGDIFISIHMNSFSKEYVNGTETYFYNYKDKPLALHIQKQLNKDIKLKNNGIKQSHLYVLKHTKSPSCLIEPLFLTNNKEHALVKTYEFREKLATSIFQGIKNYFNDLHR
jgi:N-acetylmuramoyl-L-alanine amidase CwlD